MNPKQMPTGEYAEEDRVSPSSFMTATGRVVDPFNLGPDDVCAEDIILPLSRIARYNGHVPFYSVAEHSVAVAQYVARERPELELAALLHDAAEAYLGDVISPVKRQLWVDDEESVAWHPLALVERGVLEAILTRYAAIQNDAVIKDADLRILVAEARHFYGNRWLDQWYRALPPAAPYTPACLTPEQAAVQFRGALKRHGVV